ncbi:hypothetical protein J6590_037202 [Homalodisca vitripennis]|nr:hypothetical protein J6590_037202 [Homalodisca vitripennis]
MAYSKVSKSLRYLGSKDSLPTLAMTIMDKPVRRCLIEGNCRPARSAAVSVGKTFGNVAQYSLAAPRSSAK